MSYDYGVFKTGLEDIVTQSKQASDRILPRVLRGLGGAAATELSSAALGEVAGLQGDAGRGRLRTWLRTRRIADQMGADGASVDADASHAAYNPAEEHLMIPRGSSDATIAHEAGHRRIHEALGMPFSALSALSRAGLMASPATSAWAAATKEPTRLPGYLQAAVSAPALIDEAGATALALHHQIKHRGLAGLAEAWPLVPAYGTYVAKGLGPLAITRLREKMESDA